MTKIGVSMYGLSEAAEKIGFRTRSVQATFEQIMGIGSPCILHWDQNHFVILLKLGKNKVKIADPAIGILSYSKKEFLGHWIAATSREGDPIGNALLLEPTAAFYETEPESKQQLTWQSMVGYLKQSRWRLTQIFITLLITSAIQLLFPYLTQSIVDTGITTQNLQFVVVILIAQLMLVFSRTVVDFIRTRLLLKVSNFFNLSILSDFWIKLTRLPLSYYDTHPAGDTIQRIEDHKQIQSFLTGSALNTIFSFFYFFIYAFVLISYNFSLFIIFFIGSSAYFLWVRIFLGMRRSLNYKIFSASSRENTATLQLIQGMHEIRLNNAERLKRWNWENIQASIFKLNTKSLMLSQWQQAGAVFITQSKDLVISYFVAKMVIEGQLTLGTMLAVQYIIGQLSGPIEQWVGFVQSAQDARISMERLNIIHQMKDEEDSEKNFLNILPEAKDIKFNNVSFSYPGADADPVLSNISLMVAEGKVTAIVGLSGSGKTTLLKLLLKFYEEYKGEIRVGETNFSYISPSYWRSRCGAVLQDGYIFSDTIERNIAVGDEVIDYTKLQQSCRIANILSFIESLPNGFSTRLGAEGVGTSQGQRQRLLIARAVYKDPEYIFFDEATNALDANNEKEISENLNTFFKGRTVIIVAHRLSTVRTADKIIVLHKGQIVEQGTHEFLIGIKGRYFDLVKNQLEVTA